MKKSPEGYRKGGREGEEERRQHRKKGSKNNGIRIMKLAKGRTVKRKKRKIMERKIIKER